MGALLSPLWVQNAIENAGVLGGDPHNPRLMRELGLAGIDEVLADDAAVVLRESKMEIAAPYRKMLISARPGSPASMRARGISPSATYWW